MSADRKALHVLEHKRSGIELRDNANKLSNQTIARVVEIAVADQRKPLARGAAEHAIDPASADSGRLRNIVAAERLNRTRDYNRLRKVVLVHGAMHRIPLHGRRHVEPGLFETEAESPGPGEQVDTDGSHGAEPV